MDSEALTWIKANGVGCIIYLSPNSMVRSDSLELLTRAKICTTGLPDCDCAACYSLANKSHPDVVDVRKDDFDTQMDVLHSYPTPIIRFPNIDWLSTNKQTRLLIWLETQGGRHLILMTAASVEKLLPTIRSRSLIFKELPREEFDENLVYRTRVFLQALWIGAARIEDMTDEDLAKSTTPVALNIIVKELEGRLSNRPKTMKGTNDELTALLRIFVRYDRYPASNLPFNLTAFSLLVNQRRK